MWTIGSCWKQRCSNLELRGSMLVSLSRANLRKTKLKPDYSCMFYRIPMSIWIELRNSYLTSHSQIWSCVMCLAFFGLTRAIFDINRHRVSCNEGNRSYSNNRRQYCQHSFDSADISWLHVEFIRIESFQLVSSSSTSR
jgi:hypothetical protein